MVLDNVIHNGEHSITFTIGNVSKNTWNDWGLVPSSRHSEPISGIWSNGVSIDGINGQEDLVRLYPYNAVNSTSKLDDAVVNDNRDYLMSHYGYDIFQSSSGSLSFLIADQQRSFFKIQQDIMNFLHNQSGTMVFSDDPGKIFTVRTTVESFSNAAKYSGVSINYSVIHEN